MMLLGSYRIDEVDESPFVTVWEELRAAERDALDKNDESAPFILAPEGKVNVEQLVLLLDLCKAEGWSCTIES